MDPPEFPFASQEEDQDPSSFDPDQAFYDNSFPFNFDSLYDVDPFSFDTHQQPLIPEPMHRSPYYNQEDGNVGLLQGNWPMQDVSQFNANFPLPNNAQIDPALLAPSQNTSAPYTGSFPLPANVDPSQRLVSSPYAGDLPNLLQTEADQFEPLAEASQSPWSVNANLPNRGRINRLKRPRSSIASLQDFSSKRRFKPERPRTVPGKPWIRTNNNTKGNSRTAKTNALDQLDYLSVTAHPAGWGPNFGWQGPQTGCMFEYNAFGELTQECFSAAEIADFLYNHPFRSPNAPGSLVLWVQKMPADSARRVECQYGNRCRLEDCPCHVYKQRTIGTGHYRVSIDEQWNTHGVNRNPMHVAMNVHLYCLERFLDFGDICKNFDVRADCRALPKEPHEIWGAALGVETGEAPAVDGLVAYMRAPGHAPGELQSTWSRYPAHSQYAPKAAKPQETTLAYRLCAAKAQSTGRSKLDMMIKRGANPKQYFINMGNLQWCVDQQQKEAEAKRARKGMEPPQQRRRARAARKPRATESDYEDEDFDDDIDVADADGEYSPTRPRRGPAPGATRASSRVAQQQASSQCARQPNPRNANPYVFQAGGGAVTFTDEELQ